MTSPGEIRDMQEEARDELCSALDKAAQKMIRYLEKRAKATYGTKPGYTLRVQWLSAWGLADPEGHRAFAVLLGVRRDHKKRNEDDG